MRKEKGITLIALVITIIILLILAGIAGVTIIGNIKLIEHAKYAAFISEMKQIEEAVSLKIAEQTVENASNGKEISLFENLLNEDDINNISESLRYEILYMREKIAGIDVSDKLPIEEYYGLEPLAIGENNNIYYIDGQTVGGKEGIYIYDEGSASAYKIEPTIIYGIEMYGYDYGNLVVSNEGMMAAVKESKEDPKPTINLELLIGMNDTNKKVRVTTKESKNGISKIELIKSGVVKSTKIYENEKTQIMEEFTVTENGTYEVKVTTSKTTKSETIEVSSLQVTHTIEKSNGIVTINISATNGTSIKLPNGEIVQGSEATYTITEEEVNTLKPKLTFIIRDNNNNTYSYIVSFDKIYLYSYGEENAQAGAGFVKRYASSSGATFTKNVDSLNLFANRSGPDAGVSVSTVNPINLTGYNKIIIKYKLDYYAVDWTYEAAVMYFGVLNDPVTTVKNQYGYVTVPVFTKYIVRGASSGSSQIQEVALDVSDINTNIYFGLYAGDTQSPTSRININIYEIYLTNE